jgi:ABC-type glycerol-3-phosphate transport system substrate-binding protein
VRPKQMLVALFGALLAVAGCSASQSTNTNQPSGTLTVWLMNGSAPQAIVDAVNADFKA